MQGVPRPKHSPYGTYVPICLTVKCKVDGIEDQNPLFIFIVSLPKLVLFAEYMICISNGTDV